MLWNAVGVMPVALRNVRVKWLWSANPASRAICASGTRDASRCFAYATRSARSISPTVVPVVPAEGSGQVRGLDVRVRGEHRQRQRLAEALLDRGPDVAQPERRVTPFALPRAGDEELQHQRLDHHRRESVGRAELVPQLDRDRRRRGRREMGAAVECRAVDAQAGRAASEGVGMPLPRGVHDDRLRRALARLVQHRLPVPAVEDHRRKGGVVRDLAAELVRSLPEIA